MSEPLKPCPFCGSGVLLNHDGNLQWISCNTCKYESTFLNENFWNHRPGEDALRDSLKKVTHGYHELLVTVHGEDAMNDLIQEAYKLLGEK